MLSENTGWGSGGLSRGFRGGFLWSFQVCGGASGCWRIDSMRARGSTLPPLWFHPTPASSHIRHAPAMPSKAQLTHTHSPTRLHLYTHTHTQTHACKQLLLNCMHGATDTSQMSMFALGLKPNACLKITTHMYIRTKDTHTRILADQTCTHFNHAFSPLPPRLCYCFENMIAVTDGVGRGEGSGKGRVAGPLYCLWPVWACVHSYRNWGHTGKACFHLLHRLTAGNKGSNKSPWMQCVCVWEGGLERGGGANMHTHTLKMFTWAICHSHLDTLWFLEMRQL